MTDKKTDLSVSSSKSSTDGAIMELVGTYGGSCSLKLVGREAMQKEKEERVRQEQLKKAEKERRRLEQAKRDEEVQRARKLPPNQLFVHQTDKYSQFDQQGVPTHDSSGMELSKGQIKKLQKLYQTQDKKYQEYLAETKL